MHAAGIRVTVIVSRGGARVAEIDDWPERATPGAPTFGPALFVGGQGLRLVEEAGEREVRRVGLAFLRRVLRRRGADQEQRRGEEPSALVSRPHVAIVGEGAG